MTRLMRGRKPTGPIMAERKFKSSGGARASIRVRAPARDSRTGNYRCSVEWVHSGKRELFELWGIDSISSRSREMPSRGAGQNGFLV
ncbi:hypothetical protein F0U61_53610 [Archangium violaceum]|nr:hypothetical protein F0U61_53610 [Archangium violaceum]